MSIFRESFLEEPIVFESLIESINVELLNESFDVKVVINKAKELWNKFVKWFKEQVKKIKELINDVLKKNSTKTNKTIGDNNGKSTDGIQEIKYKSFSQKSKISIPKDSDYTRILTTKKMKEYINSSGYNRHKSVVEYNAKELREYLQKYIDLYRDSAEKIIDIFYNINSDDIEIEENVSKIIDNNTILKGIIYNNIKDEQEEISRILKILNSSINLLEGYIPEYNDYIKDVTNIYNNSEEKTVKNEELMAIVKCMQFDIPNLQKLITTYQQILIKAKSVYEFNEKALQSL
jgi:hypothetical protein